MFIAHYILPFIAVFTYLVLYKRKKLNKKGFFKIDYIKKNKDKIILTETGIILIGLTLGNLVDLDHIYYRIIGNVSWLSSACNHIGEQCSFGVYPLHSYFFMFCFLIFSSLIFLKNNKIKFLGFIFLGAFSNLLLDFIMMKTGFGF
ncbi:MAG: hypothetical protein QXW97_03300 [Candidatus Pacearchaeota archaeon]